MGRLGFECWRSALMDTTWQQETAVGTCSKAPGSGVRGQGRGPG